jgi:hypothetical protein
MALRSIGGQRITSLTETGNEAARILNDIYALIRDEVLSAYPWNFAIKRDTLALSATTPEYGYSYAYALPVDCLRVIQMEDDSEFKVEGDLLLTDESEAKIKYIAQITDASAYSPTFVSAFATRLASEIAYPLANSTALAGEKYQEYLDKLRLAKSTDSQEGTAEAEEDNSWLDERQ